MSWPPACTRSPFMPRRLGKAASSPLLTCFGCRLARQRLDAQRGDAVAFAAQHPEAEPVEREALADFRNRARLVDHQTCDGGGFLIGQIPVHDAVEIADGHRAVDVDRAVRLT